MRLISDRWFNLTAGVILFITGAAKVWSAFGTDRILNYPDPVFDVSFGHLMFIVGIIELIISGLCLSNKCSRYATILVACISTNFLIYRIGLWLVDWRHPCRCLGNLTEVLHISPQTASIALKVALAYLLIGSYFTLLAPWMVNRRKIKFETQSFK
jgi:hypothetical protein